MKTITVMRDRNKFGPQFIANLFIKSAKGMAVKAECFGDNVADGQVIHFNTGDFEVRQQKGA